jgi:hypothetical protein
MSKSILLAATALLALPAPADARWGRWDTLGSHWVPLGSSRESFWVRGNERHHQVRLCVSGRAVHVTRFRLSFARGGEQNIITNRTVRPGDCTRAFDLRGRSRNIHRVHLEFFRLNGGARPRVAVQAR